MLGVQLDPRQGPQLVQIAVAKPAETSERAFTGIISARVESNLGFRVPGKVVERLVDVGQEVYAGQPLMRLDSKDLDLALTTNENEVAAARALAAQARADDARYRQLAADGWISRQRHGQVKAAADSAEAQLTAASIIGAPPSSPFEFHLQHLDRSFAEERSRAAAFCPTADLSRRRRG